jgi:hypothetical protein
MATLGATALLMFIARNRAVVHRQERRRRAGTTQISLTGTFSTLGNGGQLFPGGQKDRLCQRVGFCVLSLTTEPSPLTH